MTKARKKRVWEARNGKCWICGSPVEMTGPLVIYDHIIPLWIKGSDDDSDIAPIHALTCDKVKTPKDLKTIAKIKRLQKKSNPETRKISKIRSRGFDHSKTKKFNGQVVSRSKPHRKACPDS